MGIVATTLAFGTLGFVTIFAYLDARATRQLKQDPTHKPSTLCANSKHWTLGRQ